MIDIIQARIKELTAARDSYVAEANTTVREFNAAIATLEQLLKTPETEPSESHAEQ